MTIKQQGGIFGRNPTFNDLEVEGNLTVGGSAVTGTGTIASQDADNVNIDGGDIDGVTIGGSSAGSGSFTTLTASDDVNFDSGTFFVDASADTVGIGTATPPFPLSMAVDSPASEVMIDVGNTKYNSTNSSGESKIRFGWSNHGAANIAAYKQSTNLTGFKVYTELGFNVANLALTIDSSGNLTPAGNLVVASGQGIDFSATSDGSGTTTSELFSDYEEGTWTPTISAGGGTGTYSTQTGVYTKVGNIVTVSFDLTWSAHTGSGSMLIAGLPFSAASKAGVALGVVNNLSLSSGYYLMAYASGSEIILRQYPTGGGAIASVTLDTAASLTGTVTYKV